MNFQIAQQFLNTPVLCEPARLKARLDLFLAGKAPAPSSTVNVVRNGAITRVMQVVDGVAIVDISGIMVNRAVGAFDVELLGLTSTPAIKAELLGAIKDDAVHAIVLSIDSPGGMGFGVPELAQVVTESAKPIIAYTNALMASAAYEVAAQADEIVVTRDSLVGSIGVVITHYDQSALEEQIGVKVTEIHAGAAKVDFSGHKPMEPAALARIQGLVDSLYGQFVGAVAAGRGMPEEAVQATEAAIYTGQQAVEIGLADTIVQSGTPLTAVLARAGELASGKIPQKPRQGVNDEDRERAMADQQAPDSAKTMPLIPDERESVRIAFPVAFEAIRKEAAEEGASAGVKAGAEAERERLTQIEQHAAGVPKELLERIKKDGTPFAEAAPLMLAALQDAQKAHMATTAAAAEASPPGADAVSGDLPTALETGASPETVKAFWDGHPELKKEFPAGFECFAALVEAEGFRLKGAEL